MVNITVQDGEFTVRGTFDCGYAGFYRDDQICLEGSAQDIRDYGVEDPDFDKMTDEEIAVYFTDLINRLEEKVQKNIRLVNNQFLVNIFEGMNACAYPFWEHPEFVIPELLPEEPEKNVWTSTVASAIGSLCCNYSGKPNDGSVEKCDAEARLREVLPCFAWDDFPGHVVPHHIHIEPDGELCYECSDTTRFGNILCHAFDRLDENLCSTAWDNH